MKPVQPTSTPGRSFSRTEGPRYGVSRKIRGGKATLNQVFESEKKISPRVEVAVQLVNEICFI